MSIFLPFEARAFWRTISSRAQGSTKCFGSLITTFVRLSVGQRGSLPVRLCSTWISGKTSKLGVYILQLLSATISSLLRRRFNWESSKFKLACVLFIFRSMHCLFSLCGLAEEPMSHFTRRPDIYLRPRLDFWNREGASYSYFRICLLQAQQKGRSLHCLLRSDLSCTSL